MLAGAGGLSPLLSRAANLIIALCHSTGLPRQRARGEGSAAEQMTPLSREQQRLGVLIVWAPNDKIPLWGLFFLVVFQMTRLWGALSPSPKEKKKGMHWGVLSQKLIACRSPGLLGAEDKTQRFIPPVGILVLNVHINGVTRSTSHAGLCTVLHNLQRPRISEAPRAGSQNTAALQKATGPPLSFTFTCGQILRWPEGFYVHWHVKS